MNSRELLFLALARVPFLKPRERILLAELVDGVEDFERLGKEDLETLIGRKIRAPLFAASEYVRKAQADELYLTKRNILCTFYYDRQYPLLLKEIYDPPLVLYYRGILQKNNAPAVAVVGTRRPTGNALQAAFSLGVELAQEKVSVISGLAMGIDRAVHRGCVEGNGHAVGILGNGIDSVYPRSSKKLAEMILDTGGALASEYPPGTLPLKHHFPARNRIISGLSDAVIVVEAPEKSGALITSDYALEQGRELYIHEAGLTGERGRGTRGLAEQGAQAIASALDMIRRKEPAGEPESRSHKRGYDQSAQGAISLATLLELELQNKVIVREGEVFWRDEHGTKQ